MSSNVPGPPPQRFTSHMEHAFVEFVRGRIHKRCSEFPVFLYHVRQAELQLEEEARRVIVECLIEGFPEAWTTPQVTRDWPKAICQINADRTQARLTPSWSPETDALRGGSPVDAIDFAIRQAPPTRARRAINTLLAMIGRPVADPEPPPIGRPLEPAATKAKPEPRPGANGTAKPSVESARVEQKPSQVQPAKPARPEPGRRNLRT